MSNASMVLVLDNGTVQQRIEAAHERVVNSPILGQ